MPGYGRCLAHSSAISIATEHGNCDTTFWIRVLNIFISTVSENQLTKGTIGISKQSTSDEETLRTQVNRL